MNKVVEPVATATLKEGPDDLFDLRNTKLPRHHRDAEDEMHWAADEIERLRKERAGLLAICKIFLGHDERFQVAVGGNPIAVDKMLDHARAVLLQATNGSGS